MDVMQLVAETLKEIDNDLESALDGLTIDEVEWRPNDESNAIGFTLWHMIRAEDHWVSGFAQGLPDLFVRNGWDKRWNLPGDESGWGYGKEELAAFVTPPVGEMWEYGRQARAQTLEYMAGLRAEELSATPPFATPWQQGYTIGRMFGHILCELSQHLGHIRYLRGMQRGIDK